MDGPRGGSSRGGRLARARPIWRRAVGLGWPVALQQTLNTLMRTVDIVVTGLFSPAAVAAIGLADLYAQLPLRFGLGLGTGAIALSSQDTGRGADLSRDRAVTQALLLGFLAGLPLVVVGLLAAPFLIRVLGAEPDVVALGGAYLAIVFAASPMRIVGLVGANALQGTGDTRTPMWVNGTANVINILGTVGLGLGLYGLPDLGIIGVAIATAVARTFEAVTMTAAIASGRRSLALARPRSATVTRQLVSVSLPNVAEGLSTSIANFPFNALLLLFGTEVVAGFHIGRRLYQQLTGPLYRSFSTVSSIIVGQRLGQGDPVGARFAGGALLALSVVVLTAAGAGLALAAGPLVRVVTSDPATIRYAVDFTQVFGATMVAFGVFFPLAGALRAAGDTRTPFYARFSGTVVFLLGFSYVAAVPLGYGLVGIYVGIALTYVAWAAVVLAGFRWGDWADTAARLMAERAAEDGSVGSQ